MSPRVSHSFFHDWSGDKDTAVGAALPDCKQPEIGGSLRFSGDEGHSRHALYLASSGGRVSQAHIVLRSLKKRCCQKYALLP